MKLSSFGQKYTNLSSGILHLMDDLGSAMAGRTQMHMLGGGNPGRIPEVEIRFRARMENILSNDGEFERMIGNYDSPQGHHDFIEGLAAFLNQQFGWDVKPSNIALTNGSQSAFFVLFNLFAGQFADGSHKKILLPLAPEYIGYGDLGLTDDFFVACPPTVEYGDAHMFKYHIDFEAVKATLNDDIGAICISRPTNPTGNVLTDDEVAQLDQLAQAHNIPLIVDGAYGTPFPNIIFTDAQPLWHDNIVLCLSLSKLGLPGGRTGIIIARDEIIHAISSVSAILTLAPNSLGAVLALEMIQSGEIMCLSRDVIKPYYHSKAMQAVAWIHECFADVDYFLHQAEGAFFLWMWFRGLPINSQQLYERLKARGVLIVPGHHFFPGLADPDFPHRHQCIRLSYAQPPETVRAGIEIIAATVREAYSGK